MCLRRSNYSLSVSKYDFFYAEDFSECNYRSDKILLKLSVAYRQDQWEKMGTTSLLPSIGGNQTLLQLEISLCEEFIM